MKKIFVLSLVFASGLVQIAQDTTGKMTDTERQDIVAVAREFSDGLKTNPDFGPLVKVLFVPDFIRRHVNDDDNYNLGALYPNVAKRVSERNLLEYYILDSGFEHCKNIRRLTSADAATNAAVNLNALDKELLSAAQKRPIASIKEFRARMKVLRNTESICRSFLLSRPMDDSLAYKHEMDFRAKRDFFYRPYRELLDQSRWGFPKGTPIYTIDVPLFQLTMVSVDDRFKIINVAWQ